MKIKALLLSLLLALSSISIAAEPKERSEIDDEFKWDLTSMYASSEAWEADVIKFESRLPEIESFKGKLGKDGATLLAAVETINDINGLIADIYVYAGLKSFEDMRNGVNHFSVINRFGDIVSRPHAHGIHR